MPVPYNRNFTAYKSTQLQGLDCQTTGQIVYVGDPSILRVFSGTYTTAEAIETGECIAMVRVPRGFTVTDVHLTWSQNSTTDVVIGVGDPFCCGRFLGPVLMNFSTGGSGGSAINLPHGTAACVPLNRLNKIGRVGDGCGYGYTYTCDTDIIITNGYGANSFDSGGGSAHGSAGAVSTGSTFNNGAIASGVTFGLKVEGYINPSFTNPS